MAPCTETDEFLGKAKLLAGAALAASLLIGVQLYLITWRGEPACLNEGCRIVEGLTRVSPFLFNLFGLLFFLLVALAAVVAKNQPSILSLLKLLLLAAMAAEGVLIAFQHHIARAWCSYCLVIFGLVMLCNLIIGLRQFCSGTVLVAAVNIIFALLRFEPVALIGGGGGLASGTAAVRPGPENARSVFLVYANDCPHCLSLLEKLPEFSACTIRLNPVGEPPPIDIPGIARISSYRPEMNRLLLRLLQIEAVPVLVAAENGSYQVIRSGSGIESYLAAHCRAPAKSLPPAPETGRSETSTLRGEVPFLPPAANEECRVDAECAEPASPGGKQLIPAR